MSAKSSSGSAGPSSQFINMASMNKAETQINTLATSAYDGIKSKTLEAGGNPGSGYVPVSSVNEKMSALQKMFDSRLKEIQNRRLQPGTQTTMITGRQ